jgi:hypothetical protein
MSESAPGNDIRFGGRMKGSDRCIALLPAAERERSGRSCIYWSGLEHFLASARDFNGHFPSTVERILAINLTM